MRWARTDSNTERWLSRRCGHQGRHGKTYSRPDQLCKRACQEHSTGIKKQRQTTILPTCKQGKAFHRFKVQGGVNVFKLFYQFNPDFKVWLAQTQKLQCGHPKELWYQRRWTPACLLEMPRGKTPWLLHSLPVFRFHTPGIFVNCPLVFAVLAAIDSDVGRQEEGRRILEVCSWPRPRYSGRSLRLSSPLQRHTPLP